jgi:microcystin-dependent protein
MSNPFVAEIRPVGFNFAPVGWATCDGQILAISQNTALFSLLGTQYGGNGTATFALPDLRGRVPMHTDQYSGGGQNPIGSAGGVEAATLLISELPAHNHGFVGTTSAANVKRPVTGSAYAASTLAGSPPVSPGDMFYGPDNAVSPINPNTVQVYGSGQPHENRQPYLTISWCIALQGVFPPRS